MRKPNIGNYTVTDADMDMLARVLKDPQGSSDLVRFFKELQLKFKTNQDKCAETFMVNGDVSVRALGLGWKGKVELLDDLINILNVVNK